MTTLVVVNGTEANTGVLSALVLFTHYSNVRVNGQDQVDQVFLTLEWYDLVHILTSFNLQVAFEYALHTLGLARARVS